ncbi:MAG: FAD-binding protein [Bryobacteraceae bacterium]
MLRPENPEQLAVLLRDAACAHRTIRLGGNFSKDCLGGSPTPADVTISTASMNRLLQYEPRDLTISVEAGMPFSELVDLLAANHQMLPLDPPWLLDSTVGGVLAANLSGPRRRLYGAARDMVIGMTFATLEGKLINSGGMVVKNVAGLDMAKLMIGSFGTLAAIATVNFKVFPAPVGSRTFVMEFATAAEAFAERDRVLSSVLQPSAIDIVNWPRGFRLLIRAGGKDAVLSRYARELPLARIENDDAWDAIYEFPRHFLAANPSGKIIPMAIPLSKMCEAVESLTVPFIARAGSGVIYAHYSMGAPETLLASDFATMTKVKEMFDPERLLNRGRLYGRI